MRRILSFLTAALAVPAAFSAEPPPQDVITSTAGVTMSGTLTGRTDTGVELRSQSPTGAVVTQVVPLDNIERIDFANADKLQEEIAKTTKADARRMLQRWRQDEKFIDIPESPAGAVGVRTAQLLLEAGGTENVRTAGEILQTITDKAWSVVDKDRAKALTIESLRNAGKVEEAEKAAREYLSGDASAEGKAEVSYYLALVLADKYRIFIEDNPRWQHDPYMRPQRQRLYNEVLDNFLASYLQYGAPPEITPKSLLSSVTFLDKYGEHDEAVAIAQDLTTVFGTSPEAAEAKKFLENN
jgi:hypothetical protein